MNIKNRTWMVKSNTGEEEGPYEEEEFQSLLRAGKIPFFYEIKSNEMDSWKPILEVVSSDESFHRESTTPPPPPPEEKK